MGHAGSDVVERSAASGEANGIACERLGPRDVRDRFPQFEVSGDWRALFEPGAGFVRPERAVAAAIALARGLGAEIRTGERVLEWSEIPGGVRVRTDRATLDADALVIAAGAWTPTLAAQLGVPLVPQRVVIAWLTPRDPAAYAAPHMPVWYVDRPDAPGLYGIPTAADQGDPCGMKVAFHAGTPCDPDAPRMPPTDAELRALADATADFVPAAAGPVASSATCLYTMSPDGNFIVDRMPGATRTWIACGFSGHGFKFMPVMGEALADLATAGSTRLPVDFLRIRR
jgi:sarcosine oxidase